MNSREFTRIAGQLMRHPAAPFHEHGIRDEVEALCRKHGLRFRRDRFGNVLIRLQTGGNGRPLVLAAHLDHPGFEVLRRLSPIRFQLRFLGGVADEYFRPRIPLRLMPGSVPASLGKRMSKAKKFEVRSKQAPGTLPKYAVWELEDFAVRRDRIHGRACDDLIGVAALLAVMVDLKKSRARVNVLGVVSRAEEIGFGGALAVAMAKGLPRRALVISLETSRELPGASMGQGVILRVGDRASVFDSEATRFLGEVANQLKRSERRFRWQRALMSGGTCEATAYQEFGYQTAAVCIALGNYHNCDGHGKIDAEYVNVADAINMVELLEAAARRMRQYRRLVERLPKRLRYLRRRGERRLLRSP